MSCVTAASVEEKWRRKLPYRIYDYNYKVGESYYKPQTSYIDERDNLRKRSDPPECANFAERFASRPFYGRAYGLPYREQDAAINQPLAHPRRSSSASRGGSRYEPDDEPSFGRTGRGRDRAPRERRPSFSFDDDEDFTPRPRRRFSLADDLDFKTPVSKYVDSDYGFRSSVGKDRASGDKLMIPSVLSDSIKSDIKKLEKQFKKAETLERGTGGNRSQSWTEIVRNDAMDEPGRRTVKKDSVTFTDPLSGSTVRKSSYQERSKFESSKPPRAPPRPMRLLSLEDSYSDLKPTTRARRRHLSFSGDDDDFKFSSLSSQKSDSGDDKFNSSRKMMSQRRAEESEKLTSNINMMLGKMRKHSLGELDTYPLKNLRTSFDSDGPRRTRSVKSRLSSYGYSK